AIPAAHLAALYFAYFAYVGAQGPYFSLYLQSVGASSWQIGVLLGAMQLARIFAPNFWATRADRSGSFAKWLRLAIVLGTLAFAGMFATTAFVGMLAVLLVHAFCSGGAMPLLEAITLASLRGQIGHYGAIRLWGSVGFIVAVLAVGWQLDHAPIASQLYTVTALLVVTCAVAMFLRDASIPKRRVLVSIGPLIAQPGVKALLTACFLMTVAHGPFYAFYSIYLADHGYSKTTIGWLWSIGVIVEIVVFWLQPRWSRRFSMASVLTASLACGVLRFVMIGYGVESGVILAIAQLLHGATFGSYHVAALAITHRKFGEAAQARGQGLYMSVSFGAGGLAGALASGLAWERIGPAATFAAASICALVGLAVAWKSRKNW
ncbi:MAG: MFS transporter, partial [Burkholderiales bacterium]